MGDSDPTFKIRSPGFREFSIARRMLCWGVHLLTASGILWSLLALQAAFDLKWREAFGWLILAVVIDSVDGTLARLLHVKLVLPQFDGTLLDNLVDFSSYVLVPVVIIHRSEVLPPAWSFWIACAICLSSAYQFCQQDAKTSDHFFKGFPSYWNVTALYLLALALPAGVNCSIVLVLVAMVFVPIKYIYITRTVAFRRTTLLLTLVWSALALMIVYQLPNPHAGVVLGSLMYLVYYVSLSFYLTYASRPH